MRGHKQHGALRQRQQPLLRRLSLSLLPPPASSAASASAPATSSAPCTCRVLSSLGAQQRLSFGALAVDVNVAVPLDDEDDVAELVALLTRARLVWRFCVLACWRVGVLAC